MDIKLENVKQISSRIASIAKRGKRLDLDIHFCSVQCLLHAMDSGDMTLATRLVDAMPKSGRRKALVAWFRAFGPFNYTEDNGFSKDKGSDARKYDVETANDNPFYDFTQEIAVVDFTLERALSQLKRLNVKVNENLEGDELVAFRNAERSASDEEVISVPAGAINGTSQEETIAA